MMHKMKHGGHVFSKHEGHVFDFGSSEEGPLDQPAAPAKLRKRFPSSSLLPTNKLP